MPRVMQQERTPCAGNTKQTRAKNDGKTIPAIILVDQSERVEASEKLWNSVRNVVEATSDLSVRGTGKENDAPEKLTLYKTAIRIYE